VNKEVFKKVALRSGGRCECCQRWLGEALQKHHAFSGSNRKLMESAETVFDLCFQCHRNAHSDYDFGLTLKRKATENLLDSGWTEEQIRKRLGRWYLDD
jgi:hypothetical protein